MVEETMVTMRAPRSTRRRSHSFSTSVTMYPPSRTREMTARGAYFESCVVVVKMRKSAEVPNDVQSPATW